MSVESTVGRPRKSGRRIRDQTLLEESAAFLEGPARNLNNQIAPEDRIPVYTEQDAKYEIYRSYDLIDPRERELRRNYSIKNVVQFNSQMLKRRLERGPFYYDPNTRTTQVIGSWQVDIVLSEDFAQRQRRLHEESVSKNVAQQINDRELNLNIPKPKKAAIPFAMFSAKYRSQLRLSAPDINNNEISRRISVAWKALPEWKRQRYITKSERIKEKKKAEEMEYETVLSNAKKLIIQKLTALIVDGKDVHFDKIDYNTLVQLPKLSYDLSPAALEEKRKKKEKKAELKQHKCGICTRTVHKPPRVFAADGVPIEMEKFEIPLEPVVPPNYLRCVMCRKFFHFQCLGMSQEQFDSIIDKNNWKCKDCTPCMRCFAAISDPKRIPLSCNNCHIVYHGACLEYPLKEAPKGRWLCPNCVQCVSCGTKNPNKPDILPENVKWCNNYTLCYECNELIRAGKFCPLCSKAYRDDEPAPMVCCDGCDKWIHAACDGISDVQYTELTTNNTAYFCPTCRAASAVGDKKRKGGVEGGVPKKRK